MALVPGTTPTGPITSADVTVRPLRPPQFEDQAALNLCVKDAHRAEMWMGEKQWPLQWRETDILYQSPKISSTWDNGITMQANVSKFTVAKHVNALVPTMVSGIFYDTPPFVLRPRPGTTQETVKAKGALFSALLDEIEFQQECELGFESMATYGTAIFKYGWVTETAIEKRQVRKTAPAKVAMPFGQTKEVNTKESDEFEIREITVTKNRPFFEHRRLGTVLVDPKWNRPNQLHKAKWLVDRAYLTFDDLAKLRQNPEYDIPSDEVLKAMFFAPRDATAPMSLTEREQQNTTSIHHAAGQDEQTSEDPLEYVLKVDERWDGRRCIAVIQDKLLIRNSTHQFGGVPFLSCNWWNISNAGWGLGVGRIVGSEQRVEQGSTNAALNILSMAVNQQYVRSRGANVPTQQIRTRLGGIIDVDGKVDEAFKILEPPKVPPDVWAVIQQAKESAEAGSGADEAMVQGKLPGRGSSIGRTATGAGNIAAASATKIQGPVGRFVNGVFLPFLRALDDMVNQMMPVAEIRQILSDEMGDDVLVDMDNFLNASLKYEVLAGAHIAAKKAMAQSLPFIIQIFENPHMLESLNSTGWTVDVKQLFEMLMEMSEWKNSRQVIRKMTNDEAKSYQMQIMGAAQAKVQGDIQKIQAKHAATSQEIDQTAEARLAGKLAEDAVDRAHGYVERQIVEHAEQPQVLGTADAQYTTA